MVLNYEHARKTLEQILSTSEFSQARQLGQLRDLIRRLLERFILTGSERNIDWVGSLLEVLIFLAGLMLLIYLIRLIAPFWKIMVTDVTGERAAETAYIRSTPANLLAEAEQKALQGDYRHALRDVYLSLLMEMDDRRLIAYRAAKTNCEYLLEIRQKAAGLERNFRSMVDLFEYKWYGLEDCEREDFQKSRELYETLLKEASYG
jgi:hypothetical protein